MSKKKHKLNIYEQLSKMRREADRLCWELMYEKYVVKPKNE